jgi:hypothetical protein
MQPFIAFLAADNPYGFRLLALPGGLAVTVVSVLIYFAIPESPRWLLRKRQPQAATDIVNLIIREGRQHRAPADRRRTRGQFTNRLRPAFTLLGIVRQRPAALNYCGGAFIPLVSAAKPAASSKPSPRACRRALIRRSLVPKGFV